MISSGPRPRLFLLRLLIVLCLLCDFLMVPILAVMVGPGSPVMPGVPLFMAAIGCVLAQGNLLAAWLAWSNQPFGQRLRWHWIVAAILYLVWVAGLAIVTTARPNGFTDNFAEISSIVGLSVPLVSIAAQTPLWIARQIFGWRLIHGDPKDDTRPAPLSIRHLMWATVLVALALGLARIAPLPADDERVFLWTFMMVAASVISAMALLPAAAMLRLQSFRRGVMFAGLYATFWAGLPWGIVLVGRHLGLWGGPPLAIVVGVSCLVFSFAGTVILAAAAAREMGYQLVFGRLRYVASRRA
jgi:hypothetical protein